MRKINEKTVICSTVPKITQRVDLEIKNNFSQHKNKIKLVETKMRKIREQF